MPEISPELGAFAPIRVLLVDLDPIFRVGLKICLEESSEFDVVGELGRSSEILQRLDALHAEHQDLENPIDLLVWAIDIRQGGPSLSLGFPQLVRSRYPTVPICILMGQNDSWLLQELWQGDVAGCWLKETQQSSLLAAMRQISAGQKVWDARLLSQLSQSEQRQPVMSREKTKFALQVDQIRQRLGSRGLRELEVEIQGLDQVLAGPGLGVWERIVLEGRFRELQVARRFVQAVILPGGVPTSGRQNQVSNPEMAWQTAREREAQVSGDEAIRLPVESKIRTSQFVPPSSTDLPLGDSAEIVAAESVASESTDATVVVSENQFQTYKGVLIEAVIAKLSKNLQNLASEPLEIDILNLAKRQELFFILLRLIEETLDDLRFSQLPPAQLPTQRSLILREVWQRAMADFYGKYSMLPQQGAEVQLLPILLDDLVRVEASILAKIPWVDDWLAHLLYQSPLFVNNQPENLGSPMAMRQAEAILENLMIRLANAVVAPLLNHFGSSEVVKQNFYDQRWISTREIERFRNSLSWKYRMEQLFSEPKNIFESQVPMLVLSEVGIKRQAIYQPRDSELKDLKGIPLFVTLALEARDAVAPPLRASFTWVGRGVVYLLTQVVGRGIGLIGRGILQGVGTAWQETRPSKGDRPIDDSR